MTITPASLGCFENMCKRHSRISSMPNNSQELKVNLSVLLLLCPFNNAYQPSW